MIGYAGGSITVKAVEGYHMVGGTNMWGRKTFGGGTLWRWRDVPTYKAKLDAELAEHPADRIWWELCMQNDDLDGTGRNALYPLDDDQLHQLALDVATTKLDVGLPIYVSPMAGYTPANVCPEVSPATVDRLEAEAVRLVAEGVCLAGPHMPTLTSDQVLSFGEGCHQSAKGQRVHGKVLLAFFG